MASYKLTGSIRTDNIGTQILNDFFTYASTFQNRPFNLDLENLYWIDANLTAELFLYCHLLRRQNGLRFFIDYSSLHGHLNVLSRNGFAYYIVSEEHRHHFQKEDTRNSVIPLKAFKIEDADRFVDYINSKFLKQRGLDSLDRTTKDKIKSSYLEIFDNVGIHANSKQPIFACGQYFPAQNELKFTLTDYGDGFLKKIAQRTIKTLKISSGDKAISWAVQGNTTKDNVNGGNGLKKIMMYCYKNNGCLSIVSDGCFWSLDNRKISNYTLRNHRKGATIHLTFRNLTK